MTSVHINFITLDPTHGEIVLYLVEEGPWPSTEETWKVRLTDIQDRVLSAIDAAVDGGLAARDPDSKGKNVRIQVDTPSGAPDRLEALVAGIRGFIASNDEYSAAIRNSSFVSGLRIVTGKEMGR